MTAKQSKRYTDINSEKSLSKWQNHYNNCLDENDYRFCLDIDSAQWNYKEKRIEFIEAEEISEKSYNKLPKERLFNYGGDINKGYLAHKGERKKLLFLWNTLKENNKGKLYLIFWSVKKDSYAIHEIINIDDSDKEKPIKSILVGGYDKNGKPEKRPINYNEFKTWIKKWNMQGKKRDEI